MLLFDLIYAQLKASYLLCLVLQVGRQQITALKVADIVKVEFLLYLISAICLYHLSTYKTEYAKDDKLGVLLY